MRDSFLTEGAQAIGDLGSTAPAGHVLQVADESHLAPRTPSDARLISRVPHRPPKIPLHRALRVERC
jgi:hypothetical protein